MSAAGFVFPGKVWVMVRLRSPAPVMPVIVLGLLLYVGCGGSPSTPQHRAYSGVGYPFVADFNHDGKADVFTAPSFGDSTGTMNLGGGNGDFQAATPVPLPRGFYVKAVADFNGDGKLDLLATNCSSTGGTCDTLDVFPGNGDGTFQGGGSFGPTTDPLDGASALAGGDLNGDGKEDLVLVGPNFQASIYLGNGDGTFSTGSTYSLGSPVQPSFGIAIADFNRDGKPDIAAENIVLLGNGDGTFQVK